MYFARCLREVERHRWWLFHPIFGEGSKRLLHGPERVVFMNELAELLLGDETHGYVLRSNRNVVTPERRIASHVRANPSRFSVTRAKRLTATGPVGIRGRAPRP